MNYNKMDSVFRQRRFVVPKRTIELIALLAISSTLFLFLHTRDLSTKLRQMEGRLQYDDYNQLTNRAQTERDSQQELKSTVIENPRFRPVSNTIEEPEEDIPDPFEMNNTRKAEAEVLFFNRVPKVGSQSFMELIRRLHHKNGFAFNKDAAQKLELIRMQPVDQALLARAVMYKEPPGVFVKHVCYTNFTHFGYPNPIYMNVVRDPVERVISWYYYVRAPWYVVERKQLFPDLKLPDPAWLKKDFETCVLSGDPECLFEQDVISDGIGDHRRQSLFFCGHSSQCLPFNNPTALAMAKRTVDEAYAVVGVLEDMNATLTALEHYIPRFFRGATQLYWSEKDTFHRINRNNFKPPVSEEVKQLVRANFTREIEFYEFCRQRLHRQIRALRLDQP